MKDDKKTKRELIRELEILRGRLTAREAPDVLRVMSDTALDAVVMIDPRGRVVHWNPAAERMFGYPSEEIVGQEAHAALAPARYRSQAERALADFAVSGTGAAIGKTLELTACRKDGGELPVELSVSPVPMDGCWGACAIIRDISDRKRGEEIIEHDRRLLKQLLEIYERHRRLAAYEIHDAITQPMVAAAMSLEIFRGHLPEEYRSHLDHGLALIRESVRAARRLMVGLRPPILDELGIVSAIDHLINSQEAAGMTIEFTHRLVCDRFAPPVETAIFRIVQEALVNAVRHSQSHRVRITLAEEKKHIRVQVQDWGVGFDPQGVPPEKFGLEGIRQRAGLMGGRASIRSQPGKGTRIIADFPPLKPTADDPTE